MSTKNVFFTDELGQIINSICHAKVSGNGGEPSLEYVRGVMDTLMALALALGVRLPAMPQVEYHFPTVHVYPLSLTRG